MSKKKVKTEAENSESKKPQQPHYVKELVENGVVVLSGRSRGELDEMLSNIPSDIQYYTGAVGFYLDRGLYRIQVNRKEG
jgi:hypothetical protein